MAQLLRLAREKEAREREADVVTAKTPLEPLATPTTTTPQETIVSQTIPQKTIAEPGILKETIVSQTIVKTAKSSRGLKTDLPEAKPAKETRRSQPPAGGAVDVSKGYYPSYNDLSDRLIPELGLNPFEQSVLQRLYRLSRGWKSDECEVGLGTLSKFCVMSRSQVQRSVAVLIEKGLIINLGPAKKGSKDGNRYRVLPGVPTAPTQTIVRQTIVPEEGTIPSQNTEVSQTIVTGNTNKNSNKEVLNTHSQTPLGVRAGSKFTLDECRRFAESLRADGIQNPGGYATAVHRSGEADDRIEAFLAQQGGAREEKPALSAEQVQEQANVAASMLQHGSSIEEVELLLSGNFRPSQWRMIRSVALAQAKLSGKPVKPKDPKG
jgi:predicted transcriptional regulator